jgi:hypothetical protein
MLTANVGGTKSLMLLILLILSKKHPPNPIKKTPPAPCEAGGVIKTNNSLSEI